MEHTGEVGTMEFTGRLKGISKNWLTEKIEITFEAEEIAVNQTETVKDKRLFIAAKEYRKKRSLDANAYYWQMVTKLSDVLQVSKTRMHNLLLRRYGRPEIIDDKLVYLVLPDSDSGKDMALEAETYHIRPTAQVKEGADGLMYRTYLMLRGSSTYDTREMGVLIDGLVSECKDQGIETLPPDEMERMMQAYDQKWRKKHHEETVQRADG